MLFNAYNLIFIVEEEIIVSIYGKREEALSTEKAMETKDGYQLREPSVFNRSHLKCKNVAIGVDNTYYWNVNL